MDQEKIREQASAWLAKLDANPAEVDYTALNSWLEAWLLSPDAKAALQAPLVRHGVTANRKVLETITQYSFEQGLASRQLKLKEIFARNNLDN